MLKRLAEFYRVPAATFVVVAIAGLAAFWVVIGIATYRGLLELWPAVPAALAGAAAIVVPPATVGLIAVAAAWHDRLARDPRTGQRLKLLELLIVATVAAFLVFWIASSL
jgi:hypothetical protein